MSDSFHSIFLCFRHGTGRTGYASELVAEHLAADGFRQVEQFACRSIKSSRKINFRSTGRRRQSVERQSVERAELESVATLHALTLHAPGKKSGGSKLFLRDPHEFSRTSSLTVEASTLTCGPYLRFNLTRN